MGKPQPAKATKRQHVEFDEKGLCEKLNTRIRQALEERPCGEDVEDDEDWGSMAGEYLSLVLLPSKPR